MLDIHNLMADLALHRPIFHSEADFQHALAWQIHKAIPNCEIRLEMPYRRPQGNWYLDIWLSTSRIAIELKHRTKPLELKYKAEHFLLSDRNFPPGRYDFFKDIQRLERMVADRKIKSGFGVLLTNGLSYWDPPKGESWRKTTDAAFRLHEDQKITGELA